MLLRLLPVALLLAASADVRADDADAESGQKTLWGLGAKVRRSYITEDVQKLFLDDTPGGATMDGAGIDFARRRGMTEVVFGFGADRLDAKDGYYLDKGGDPLVPGNVDYVTFHDLRWYTVELTVINHAELHKFLEFRYGAGVGLGLIQGEMRKTDAVCAGNSLQRDCIADPLGMQVNEPANIPPVLPVINVLLGLQLKPFQFLHIHLDAGLHTVPYVSLGAKLYLW